MNERVILQDCHVAGGVAVLRFSDGDVLEVAEAALPEGLPNVGEPVSDALRDLLRVAAERKRIARAVFLMLDRRLYPVAHLRRRLIEDGFSAEAVAEVLDEFAAKGLHSDHHFAAAFCRDTIRRRPVGSRYLLSKLLAKRVPETVAREVLRDELSPEDEARMARMAAASRWRRHHGPIDFKARAGVGRFLQSRGFPAALIRDAVDATEPPATAAEE